MAFCDKLYPDTNHVNIHRLVNINKLKRGGEGVRDRLNKQKIGTAGLNSVIGQEMTKHVFEEFTMVNEILL